MTHPLSRFTAEELAQLYANVGALLRSGVLEPREAQLMTSLRDRLDVAVMEQRQVREARAGSSATAEREALEYRIAAGEQS
jgi:hypothetical protein